MASESPDATLRDEATATEADSFEELLRQVAAAPEVALPLELQPGEVLEDNFEIGDRIGSGGMGVVYRARDRRLGRDVAIKLHVGPPGEQAFERLMREAKAMAQLAHPNVITVHEVGTVRGHLFIAMEYVEGDTARGWLAGERDARDILEVFVQAGRGLEAAHAAGLVHRDFKPDNMFIGTDGRARVGDFGLARPSGHDEVADAAAAATASPTITATGALMGTPAYMAPEQLAGEPATPSSDQFSFCVALWEALAGNRPFDGDTPTAIRASIEEAPALPPLPESTPKRVAAALRRGLVPDPEGRFPSMTELLAELEPAPRASKAGWIAFGLAAASAVAAVVYALSGAAGGAGQPGAAICEGAGAELAAVWSPSRRAGVEKAFRATGLSYAGAAYDAVTALVSRYAADIAAGRVRACRDAQVLGHVSETMYERQLSCLRGRERQLDSLLEVWERADATVVRNANQAVAALPPVAECRDQSYLTAQVKPPSDPEVAAAVETLRGTLSRGVALVESGKLEAAEAKLSGAVERARQLGYEPIVAESLLARGRLLQSRDRFADAESSVRQAYLAARRGGADELAGEAAALLSRVVGIDRAQEGEGALWQQLAQVEVERGGSPALELVVLESLGAVADFQGHYEEALDLRRRALALARTLFGEGHPKVASALVDVASTLHAMGRLRESAERYREALAVVEKRLGKRHPDTALILRSLGLVDAYRGEPALAREELEQAVDVLSEVFGPRGLETGYALLNLGVAYHAANDYEEAIERYLQALSIIEERLGKSHPDVSLCLNSLAVAHEGLDQYDQAIAYYRRALEIARGQGATHPQVAVVLGNIGALYYEKGDYRRAVDELRASLAVWEAIGPDNTKMAVPLTSLAESLLELHRARDAEVPARRALDLLEGEASDPRRLARARFALGRSLWDTGRRKRGLELARSAEQAFASKPELDPERLARVRRWLARHERNRLP